MVNDLDPSHGEVHSSKRGFCRISNCSPRASTAASGRPSARRALTCASSSFMKVRWRDKAKPENRRQKLSIDGQDAKGFTEQASTRLKGEPGVVVRVTVEQSSTARSRRRRSAANASPSWACPTSDGPPTGSATSATAISTEGVLRGDACGPSNGCAGKAT